MEHLSGLSNLEELHLSHTQITNDELKHPEGLTGLEALDLQHTQVTEEGVKKLQEALPNCEIIH
ncbi:MAG: hypothetical protein H8E44_41655 [Planctomycetes bacterium]|nr:hypothetical protein [Planctomycetota bacterium]MBL7044514.1 hypothetical protein [Pirellulaceae bacterium]